MQPCKRKSKPVRYLTQIQIPLPFFKIDFMKHKIIDHLELIAKLMELHNENPFKTKAYISASNTLYNTDINDENIPSMQWNKIKGIGESIATTISEFVSTGSSNISKKYVASTPKGILELVFSIRGLGVKKIATLWKGHGISSIEQLYEACMKNELQNIKGFGLKMEEKMKERIEFYFQHKGLKLFAKTIALAKDLCLQLSLFAPNEKHEITDELRRQLPIVKHIAIVTTCSIEKLKSFLVDNQFDILAETEKEINAYHGLFRDVVFFLATTNTFGTRLFETSSSKNFLDAWGTLPLSENEQQIFDDKHVDYLPPYLREDKTFLDKKYTADFFANIIQTKDIKGLIHCHSQWSDGEHTIQQMANECIKKGLEYMVITDHSKSSFVANGLSEERLQQQWKEIEHLNETLAPFKIFKGIECDILSDGSLDYREEILAQFDLVIISIHNNLEMDKETATTRMLNAIKNQYTHIIGHSSGRLLLNRKGYELDYEKIFAACIEYGVAIECNANPFRLDIDWIYLNRMQEANILTSINPDAHSIYGISDIEFGVAIAQKAGLQKRNNISSYSLATFELFVANMKKKIKN